MSGLYSYIDHDFDEPLIVMGDIRMKGNTRIGKSSNPINLSCHGTLSIKSPAKIYYTPPIGDDVFAPPRLDVEVYVNNFKDQLESGLPFDGSSVDAWQPRRPVGSDVLLG